MILDLVLPSNLNSYNITLAHTIGLSSAVYCNELLNILGQVTKKNKFDEDGYFKLDRNYVFRRTTISIADQLSIDSSLSKVNLISKKSDDVIKLDVQLLCDIMANDNVNINKEINMKTVVKDSDEAKAIKREAKKNNVKRNISCDDEELKQALCNWIDSLYEMGKGASKQTVLDFQDKLFKYTDGYVDKALEIVRIATVNGYRECQWAINIYEKDLKNRSRMINSNTVMNRVKEENMSSDGEIIDVYY